MADTAVTAEYGAAIMDLDGNFDGKLNFEFQATPRLLCMLGKDQTKVQQRYVDIDGTGKITVEEAPENGCVLSECYGRHPDQWRARRLL